MPKIQWDRLPRAKWTHLRDRAKEREISEGDLFDLAEWKAQDHRCARRRLVQRLRNVQTVWHRQILKYVPAGRAGRARQAIVNVAG